MSSDQPPDPKLPVSLRLPPILVQFLDREAKARFTSRNEVIQSIIVDAFKAAQSLR
jgi:hypothetical protein